MDKYDAHCTLTACTCPHDYCYKGWIDSLTGQTTAPCPYCRESLSHRLHQAEQAKGKGYPPQSVQRILVSMKT